MEIRFFVEVDNYWSTVGLQQHATNHSNTFLFLNQQQLFTVQCLAMSARIPKFCDIYSFL